MITHNSFKLIIDEKNKEAQKLRDQLSYLENKRADLENEREILFKKLFRRPVRCITIEEDGNAIVRTESGETLIFQIILLGEAVNK